MWTLMQSQEMRKWAQSVHAAEKNALICTRDEREKLKCKYSLSILWSGHEYNVMQHSNLKLDKVEFKKFQFQTLQQETTVIHWRKMNLPTQILTCKFFCFFLKDKRKTLICVCRIWHSPCTATIPSTQIWCNHCSSTVPALSCFPPCAVFAFKFNNLPAVCFSRESPSSPGQ